MEIYFVKLVFDKIQIGILLSKRHIFLFQFVQSLKADSIIGGSIQVSTSGVTRIGTTGLFTAIVIDWATIQIYRFSGGSGSTLLIACWMAAQAKLTQLREIGKVEAVPALFNIHQQKSRQLAASFIAL